MNLLVDKSYVTDFEFGIGRNVEGIVSVNIGHRARARSFYSDSCTDEWFSVSVFYSAADALRRILLRLRLFAGSSRPCRNRDLAIVDLIIQPHLTTYVGKDVFNRLAFGLESYLFAENVFNLLVVNENLLAVELDVVEHLFYGCFVSA